MAIPPSPIAYASADLPADRPPTWVWLTCLAAAAGILLFGSFAGVIAGAQAAQLAAGLRDARRVAALPNRAMAPGEIAWLMTRASGPITPAQIRTVEHLLADPGQTLLPPRPAGASHAGEYVPSASQTGSGGGVVLVYGSHPFVETNVTLNGTGRLTRADRLDWATGCGRRPSLPPM